MLPWKRSKFVLVKKDKKTKGVSYSSLLSSFVRSCPDLLPQTPLARLGKVFSTRRQKVELNKDDPSYTVWYLGNAVTLRAKGEGCTAEVVDKIWEKSEFGGYSTKMKLSLGPYGIRMTPCRKGARKTVHTYLLHRITCCVQETRHPKVFSWVYRHQIKNKAVVLRCHAVLVSRAEKAKAMAQTLCQTSLAAFKEFKSLKRQSDFRREQQELLGDLVVPMIPLRKVLNGTCSYNPPSERSKTVPRLSSILEEEEDTEEERTDRHRTPSPIRDRFISHQQDKDAILELAQELRRLSIQRELAKKIQYMSTTHIPDWKWALQTIC
ncbi:protein FAM43B [Aquarana catesbeiana]|uniref:protein FAM43B n=1 Tax=Aquarana catesbeiana TaxID=8400 RepID=UPI003CCA4EBB